MEPFLELLFQIFGEILLQILIDAGVDWSWRRRENNKRKPDPIQLTRFEQTKQSTQNNQSLNRWLAGAIYLLLGALVGALSLALVPKLITSEAWQIANLLITPLISGAFMAQLGASRKRKEQPVIRPEHFWFGFLFAFGMAFARFVWTW